MVSTHGYRRGTAAFLFPFANTLAISRIFCFCRYEDREKKRIEWRGREREEEYEKKREGFDASALPSRVLLVLLVPPVPFAYGRTVGTRYNGGRKNRRDITPEFRRCSGERDRWSLGRIEAGARVGPSERFGTFQDVPGRSPRDVSTQRARLIYAISLGR